jgi:ankyrin repeat protein
MNFDNPNQELKESIEKNNIDKFKTLINKVDINDTDYFFLAQACSLNRIEMIKILLNIKELDPSIEDNYVLSVVAQKGHLEVMKLLLSDNRIKPSSNNNELDIYQATYYKNFDIIELWLTIDNKIDPSDMDNFCIKSAFINKEYRLVDLLLTYKSVINKLKSTPSEINSIAILDYFIKKNIKSKLKGFNNE